MNSLFQQLQHLNDKQLLVLEEEFQAVLASPKDRETLFTFLDAQFRSAKYKKEYEFRGTYFRWYTELFWRRINELSIEDLIDIGIARQLPLAILLNFDIFPTLFTYLNTYTIEIDEMQSYYNKIRNTFFASEAIVGVWQGTEVVVKDLALELQLANRQEADSLEVANLFSKIQTIFTVKNEPFLSKLVLDPATASTHFIDVSNFFFGVEPEKIWYVVDGFMNPELYNKTEIQGAEAVENVGLIQGQSENLPVAAQIAVEKPTYAEIKQRIDTDFTKDGSGQFIDPTAVFKKLDTLAVEYDDDAILDLYYYNEAAGKFQWNEELLAQ